MVLRAEANGTATPAARPTRTTATAPPTSRPLWLARAAVWAMVLLGVWVQVFVWGAPKPHGNGGALLPQFRHIFGLGYAAVLLALELLLCAACRNWRVSGWVIVVAACVDLAFWAAHLAGRNFPVGAAASLTAAAGAVLLAAAMLNGRVQLTATRHADNRNDREA